MTGLPKIVIATSNPGKLKEIRNELESLNATVLSLQDFPGIPEAPEEGNTFSEIAMRKARFYHQHLKMPVLAEDSGLIIPSLDGYPGIFSARVALSDAERIRIILDRLKGKKDRSAFYHCSMVFFTSDVTIEATGRCDGQIVNTPQGNFGFGYDPIFQPESHVRTFAEMELSEKAEYSHRGRALKEILPKLREWVQKHS